MTEEFLHNYIDGKLGKKDRKEVVKWIHSSKENADRYAEIKADYVFATMPDITLKSRERRRRDFTLALTRIAAALLLPVAALAAWSFVTQEKRLDTYATLYENLKGRSIDATGMMEYTVNSGVKGKVVLPDSTVVWLNSATTLSCPSVFDPEKREVTLVGEAFFDVRTNPDWPMYIKTTKGFTAKVTGTKFNLSAYNNDEELKLTLLEGKVSLLEDVTHQEIEVAPMDEIKLKETGTVNGTPKYSGVKQAANVYNNTAWKDGFLVFDDTPMTEVIRKMERWYGVSIDIKDPKIEAYHFTANFSSESLDRVLELIKSSSFVDYTIDGKMVTLY